LSINDHGYVFHPDDYSNTAFMPLFPYVWRILDLSPLVVSIVNAALFATGIYLLLRVFEPRTSVR
jgi:hypothetical protein